MKLKLRIIWFVAVHALILVLVFGLSAMAGPYEVSGIEVQASGDDAVQAKNQAIADGQDLAIRTMLERITITADHERLPAPSQAEIDVMISGFGIDEEHTSSTTYKARLTYHFDRQSVRDILLRAGIPFNDQEAAPTLVIPIYQEGEQFFLWDSNPFLEAWRLLDPGNRLTPVVLPDGDQSDADIDPNAVLARDVDTFSGLRVRYRIQNILVALCQTGIDRARYDCTLEGGGPGGPVSAQQSYSGEQQATMQVAAREFLDALENQWKSENMTGMPGMRAGEPVEATVSFSGLREWQLLRSRLIGLPEVSEVEVRALNPRGALLVLHVSGGPAVLSGALAPLGLELADAGGIWVIRPY